MDRPLLPACCTADGSAAEAHSTAIVHSALPLPRTALRSPLYDRKQPRRSASSLALIAASHHCDRRCDAVQLGDTAAALRVHRCAHLLRAVGSFAAVPAEAVLR